MTPLERAARAIADNPVNWLDYVPQVRAVIEAIREPSEAMHVATVAEADRIGHPISTQQAWHSMIDALLQENPQA